MEGAPISAENDNHAGQKANSEVSLDDIFAVLREESPLSEPVQAALDGILNYFGALGIEYAEPYIADGRATVSILSINNSTWAYMPTLIVMHQVVQVDYIFANISVNESSITEEKALLDKMLGSMLNISFSINEQLSGWSQLVSSAFETDHSVITKATARIPYVDSSSLGNAVLSTILASKDLASNMGKLLSLPS